MAAKEETVAPEADEESISEEAFQVEIETANKSSCNSGDKINNEAVNFMKSFISSTNRSRSVKYFSEIPERCKTEPCMLGVDEAGRGPVLGPMVYGIAICPLSEKKLLEDLGFMDSKMLTENNREIIFNRMFTEEKPKDCISWSVELISPHYISTSMYQRVKRSLNEVSMNSAISLIEDALDAKINVTEIYVDTVGPPEKYQQKLSAIFPNIKITVAKKADSTYPIVSAASICAKVSRDLALKVWKFDEANFQDLNQRDFGSGYPNDPVTKRFLAESYNRFFGYPRLVRFSWSTAEQALERSKSIDIKFDTDEEETSKAGSKKRLKNVPAISNFFKNDEKEGLDIPFFKRRMLSNTTEF